MKTLCLPQQNVLSLDIPTLGEEQQLALCELRAFMQAEDRDFHLLKGYAGTGKSTLCRVFLAEIGLKGIIFCATTNKATGVLKNLMLKDQPDVRCTTIHRLLKLIPEDSGQGWKLRQVGEPQLQGLRLIVLDECSMISSDLWKYLQELPCRRPIKILFMGDPAQLPPVGEDLSPSFDIPFYSQLTRVYRQGQDHPILKYSMELREAMQYPDLPIPFPVENAGSDIVIFKNENAWLNSWLADLSESASQSDEDRVRCLTWTNRRVLRWNQWISPRCYPTDRGPFPQLQPLMLTSPVTQGGWTSPYLMLMATDESVRCHSSQPYDWRGLSLWELELHNRDGEVAHIVYCPPESEQDLDRELSLWQLERQGKSFNHEVIEKWKRRCVGLQPAAAMTVHRSQGSTFDTVYLDGPSLRACPDRDLQLQLLYVAVTRARHRLCILA